MPPKKNKAEPVGSRIFVKSSFGFARWEGWGFLSGLGLGLFPSINSQMGWTLEGRLHLVSQGSLFTVLVGPSYYLGSPLFSRRVISLGFLLGAGFPGGEIPFKKMAAIGLFEIASNHRLSDYAWFRVWSRAGLFEKEATAQLGFSLLFQLK